MQIAKVISLGSLHQSKIIKINTKQKLSKTCARNKRTNEQTKTYKYNGRKIINKPWIDCGLTGGVGYYPSLKTIMFMRFRPQCKISLMWSKQIFNYWFEMGLKKNISFRRIARPRIIMHSLQAAAFMFNDRVINVLRITLKQLQINVC